MKTRAAVVYEPGKRIETEQPDLDGPQGGEVLVREEVGPGVTRGIVVLEH